MMKSVCCCLLAVSVLATVSAAVAPHPRLVADAEDFKALSVRLEKSDLGRQARARLFREAEALMESPALAYCKDESGKRILHISRAALDRIAKMAMAYRLSGDARYARRAIDEAMSVSAFSDWNPSHFLDTAEMSLAVAICFDWLYDRLSNAERETLSEAILHKALVDEKGELRGGWWVDYPNNWCQVCHGGLVAGAIATAERHPELTRKVIDRAVVNVPKAMGVFAPDGGFPEGPTGYWPYAMEYNTLLLWEIEKYDGTDHELCSLPGFAAEVEYLDACTGPTHATFNYSDAGSYSLDKRGAAFPQWWLAKRFKRPDTLVFHERDALRRYLASPVSKQPTKRSFNRFYPLLLLCFDDPAADTKIASPLARVIRGENDIAVMRTSWTDPDAWYAGLKGGRPSCSHGHMDVGSFVLEADGVRWIRDLGCETYAKVEASQIGGRLWNHRQESPRWTLFRYATRGHGTLQFNDEPQNVEATAHFEPMTIGEEMSTRLDLSPIYGRDAFRTFTMGKNGGFTVKDELRAGRTAATVTWRVNTCADVQVAGNRAMLTATNAAGRVCRLLVTASPSDVVFSVVDRSKAEHDYELDNPDVKQLVFTRTMAASETTSFSVSFATPAADEPFVAAAPAAEAELRALLPTVFAKSAEHYKALDAAATPLSKGEKVLFPHGWRKWKTGKDEYDMRDIYWWTSGHFPGSLWYLYEATGDAALKDAALRWTEILEPLKDHDKTHDIGFMVYCSYGNARRILKTDRYDAILIKTADSLSHRFNEQLGVIRSWGEIDEKKNFLVIPDNMMNLELLEFAAKAKGGDARFDRIARSHADKSMANHFRADGGCYHVLDYDQREGMSGSVQAIQRGQGLSCLTAWSRGQAWGIYGYTMMYRETRDPKYLAFAKKLADYAMNHPNMPADGVPYWDFGAPGEERDSSAAACMASALLELSQYAIDNSNNQTIQTIKQSNNPYRAFAVKQLLALCTPEYFSEGNEIGHFLLKHGVGHKPAKSEVDTPLCYGDYYFLEALLRFRMLVK